MLELLYTSLLLFCIFIILFFILPCFQLVKYIIVLSQLIICFILFSNNFYKKHILWKNNYYAFVHTLNSSPIINLYLSNDTLYSENLKDFNYSIILTKDYFFKCRENFYINSDICPISNIIIENQKNKEYNNYIELKISENKYLYYTREMKYDKLFEANDLNNLNFTNISFNSKNNYEQYISNDTFIFNFFKNIKDATYYIDFLCLSLLLFSIIYLFFESFDSLIFNPFKIVNTFIQIMIFLLYLFRYLKFIKIKIINMKRIIFHINYLILIVLL